MADRQMLLDLGRAPSLTREDLIVTDANRDAAALVDRWPGWASPFAVIAGGPGSGKTHLASVWQSVSGAHAMVDPQRPSAADLDAAQAGTPILCDGLTPEGLDEAAFFHLLNAVRGAGGSILITAETAPSGWSLATPDLMSRFRAATVASLGLPDDDLLRAVAVKLFADRQVAVDPSVVAYLLPRLERSLSALADIVVRLDEVALARKMSITRPLAAEVLRDLGEPDQPDLSL
ncbi:MAG: DnaA/Hda family protein [Phyllobacteriaceae bacterium]|jgi:chromosomal replication initiation ATPase DnaA|nr:DnaA/Hda family protein [Phyllobacteriaceae bacterium]